MNLTSLGNMSSHIKVDTPRIEVFDTSEVLPIELDKLHKKLWDDG